ncbi:trans-aconitate 2-methyltransferase [Pantoea anthophila]|uniref:trans-aconitate 2-methyltransferase n=1 Tax=Pantoea anthophila TaxID=470931 RepID=UPI002DBA87DE|nr:trans-aconitate 2-methyltransferase [Pantoea anthophila]MEB5706380.1 trans-aconitate 2-methyltransferase [Pantoea anthophila]MEB6517251.1 trans-aconitate 2-methyltransferase [Pantoea anthophila]
MKEWDPVLYRKFEAERTRPAHELLARIRPEQVEQVTDLGCGPGNSTELLADAWPLAQITGLDSSAAMLMQARERLPHCRFVQADIRSWQAEVPQQVIYANASLQWLDDHTALFPHLVRQLAPGGVLAVQMPDNLDEPSHQLMREVAATARWRSQIRTADRVALLSAGAYYDLLTQAGCEVDIWRTTYYHVMADAQAIISWLQATGLRPFLASLDEASQAAFLADYHQQLLSAYPARADGQVLLAFPRLFMVAVKKGA